MKLYIVFLSFGSLRTQPSNFLVACRKCKTQPTPSLGFILCNINTWTTHLPSKEPNPTQRHRTPHNLGLNQNVYFHYTSKPTTTEEPVKHHYEQPTILIFLWYLFVSQKLHFFFEKCLIFWLRVYLMRSIVIALLSPSVSPSLNILETAYWFFLIFCMKLGQYKGTKLTEPNFWKKILGVTNGGNPHFWCIFDVFCPYLKNGSNDFVEILLLNIPHWYLTPRKNRMP